MWKQFYPENEVFELLVSGYKLFVYLRLVGREQNIKLAEHFGCNAAKTSRYLANGYKYGLLNAELDPNDMRNKFFSLKPETEMALDLIEEFISKHFVLDAIQAPDISINNQEKR